MFDNIDIKTGVAIAIICISLISIVIWYVYTTRKQIEPKTVASIATPVVELDKSSGGLTLPIEKEQNINVEQVVDARTKNCPRCDEKTVIASSGTEKIRFCMKCKGYYDCPNCETQSSGEVIV